MAPGLPKSSLGWVIAAVVLVIVLAGGGVGIWLIVRASKKSKAKKKASRTSAPVPSATVPPLAAVPMVYAPLSTPDLGPQTSSQLGFQAAVARSLARAPTMPEQQANWKNKVPLVLTTQQIQNKKVQTAQQKPARTAIAVSSAKLKAGAAETNAARSPAPKFDNAALWKKVAESKNRALTARETAEKAKNAAAWAAVGAKLRANKKGGAAGATTGVGTGTWMRAAATWYTSHPKCCKGASNYDAKADKKECDENNGCTWAGQFAGLNKKLSPAEVAKRDIVAFYDAKNQKGDKKAAQSWWNKNVKGKKIELKKPDGTTMIVEALDTCSDSDCGGCCTKNANKGGGYLIDLEESTAKRFYGGKIQDMNTNIQWRWAK